MVKVINNYLARKSTKSIKGNESKYRTWFLIKSSSLNTGRVELYCVTFPKEYIGKKVRFKVEIADDNDLIWGKKNERCERIF